jgi:O-6-methylguanine DNA methyltransferase
LSYRKKCFLLEIPRKIMEQVSFTERALKVVANIPKGKVLTYKQVAKRAGSPKAYRAVGNILNKNYNPKVPCHRVVRSDGTPGGFRTGTKNKLKLLKQEGIAL